ncbi:trp operon leader peptide [Enterobacter hormaechei]
MTAHFALHGWWRIS